MVPMEKTGQKETPAKMGQMGGVEQMAEMEKMAQMEQMGWQVLKVKREGMGLMVPQE